MREYLILTFTFTAPFIMLFLLNVLIDDLPRLCSVLRELSTPSTKSTKFALPRPAGGRP